MVNRGSSNHPITVRFGKCVSVLATLASSTRNDRFGRSSAIRVINITFSFRPSCSSCSKHTSRHPVVTNNALSIAQGSIEVFYNPQPDYFIQLFPTIIIAIKVAICFL